MKYIERNDIRPGQRNCTPVHLQLKEKGAEVLVVRGSAICKGAQPQTCDDQADNVSRKSINSGFSFAPPDIDVACLDLTMHLIRASKSANTQNSI